MAILIKYSIRIVLPLLLMLACPSLKAQDSTQAKLLQLPSKLFKAMDKKAASLNAQLQKQTEKYLRRLDRQEKKLHERLLKKDSALANRLFDQNLITREPKLGSAYNGHLDSLTTALRFLKQNQAGQSLNQIDHALSGWQDLQKQLDASEALKKQLQKRQEAIKQQLQSLGMMKELKKYRETIIYYQAQVEEYKKTLSDPRKMEAALLQALQKVPAFKDFFARNSLMGAMFPMPSSGANPAMALGGLQTSASVMQALTNQFGSGTNALQMMQQNVQNAQGQLSQLRSQLNGYTSGSYGNGDDPQMPAFQPNNQRTKSFGDRLEWGFNAQSQKAKWMFPTTTDLGAQLGYKLNDNGSVGLGMSYKIGWGKSWNQIEITHQGIGLRSYIDWKIKGSFYLSGGYEQNYRSAFKTIDALKDQSAWQSSGLIGLSKKYKLNSKMKGELKLLWDFLSYRQSPQPNSILFRIGYQLK